MKKKKKILYITPSLQRAGAEKYVHDLITSLDKNIFDPQILTVSDVDHNKIFPHVYYFSLKKKGFKIYKFLLPNYKIISKILKYTLVNILLNEKFSNYLSKLLRIFILHSHRLRLKMLFKKFDYICVIDALSFNLVKDSLREFSNFDVHLMCHQIQFNNGVYRHFEKGKRYNFVYIDAQQLEEVKAEEILIGNNFLFPLSLKLSDYNIEDNLLSRISEVKGVEHHIGIFTRINNCKPIDIFLKAFQEIINKGESQVKLHIFGTTTQDPTYLAHLKEFISKNNLDQMVIFEGHSDDMINSIKEKNIDLVWGLSIYSFMGFSSLEIGAYGIPIILNNIDISINRADNDSKQCPPYFTNYVDLAAYTSTLLNSNNKKIDLGELIKKKIAEEHDLDKNITNYQKYLLDVIDKN